MNPANVQYYEVTSERAFKSSRKKQQINKYFNAVIQNTASNRLKVSESLIGMPIKPGEDIVCGSFQYGVYDIEYNNFKNSSVIVYEVNVNPERVLKLLTTAAIAALIVAFPELAIPATFDSGVIGAVA